MRLRPRLAAVGRFLVGMAVLTYLSDLVIAAIRHHLWGVGALFAGWTCLFAVLIWVTDLRKSRKRSSMSLLSKEQIFAADDRKWEDVSVPEWGGEVRILGLDGTGRDAYESSIQKVVNGKVVRDDRNFRARLVALCAIYEDGRLMFDQNEVAALARRSSAALSRLFDKACELSGITEEDQAALTENFDDAPAGPSTSASPPTSDAPSPSYWPGSAPTN